MIRRPALSGVGVILVVALLSARGFAAVTADETRLVNVLLDAGRPLEERLEAADTLEQQGWQPATDQERAWYLVARQEWEGAAAVGAPAVEPLLRALRDADPIVRGSAAAALGVSGGSGVADALMNALGDPHPLVRRNAVRSLARLGSDSTAALFALAGDARASSRWEAAEVLALRRDSRIVEILTAAISDRGLEMQDRTRAAEALERSGAALRDGPAGIDFLIAMGDWGNPALIGDPRAVEPLIATLGDRDGLIRRSAAAALGRLRDPRAVEPLITLLGDGETMVQDVALSALGMTDAPWAQAPLAAALRDATASRARRKLIEKTLAAVGWRPTDVTDQVHAKVAREEWDGVPAFGEPAVDVLIPLLRHGDGYLVRRRAAVALGKIGSRQAAPALVALLQDKVHDVAEAAATALVSIGDHSVADAIISLLDSPSTSSLDYALKVLGDLGEQRAVEPIIRHLDKRGCRYQNEALRALGKLGAAAGVAPLLRCLDYRDNFGYTSWDDVAVEALIRIGQPALEQVLASFSDSAARSRGGEARILGKLGDPRAVAPLLAYLPQATEYELKDVIEALGAIGDPRAVDSLLSYAREGKADLRVAATTALGAIGDPRVIEVLRQLAEDTNAQVRTAAVAGLKRRDAR